MPLRIFFMSLFFYLLSFSSACAQSRYIVELGGTMILPINKRHQYNPTSIGGRENYVSYNYEYNNQYNFYAEAGYLFKLNEALYLRTAVRLGSIESKITIDTSSYSKKVDNPLIYVHSKPLNGGLAINIGKLIFKKKVLLSTGFYLNILLRSYTTFATADGNRSSENSLRAISDKIAENYFIPNLYGYINIKNEKLKLKIGCDFLFSKQTKRIFLSNSIGINYSLKKMK